MPITYGEPDKEKKVDENIYFGTKKVGVMHTYLNRAHGSKSRFHASLDLNNITSKWMNGSGLAQGHGDTPEEAIDDAFKTSREYTQHYTSALDNLEALYRKESGQQPEQPQCRHDVKKLFAGLEDVQPEQQAAEA